MCSNMLSDGNVRYYEYEEDTLHPLPEHKSSVPQRGMCFLLRGALSIQHCDTVRAYKVVGSSIEPIAFIVSRKVRHPSRYARSCSRRSPGRFVPTGHVPIRSFEWAVPRRRRALPEKNLSLKLFNLDRREFFTAAACVAALPTPTPIETTSALTPEPQRHLSPPRVRRGRSLPSLRPPLSLPRRQLSHDLQSTGLRHPSRSGAEAPQRLRYSRKRMWRWKVSRGK
jgi:coronin-1B/1C/6